MVRDVDRPASTALRSLSMGNVTPLLSVALKESCVPPYGVATMKRGRNFGLGCTGSLARFVCHPITPDE
jgi:hypothetical protein